MAAYFFHGSVDSLALTRQFLILTFHLVAIRWRLGPVIWRPKWDGHITWSIQRLSVDKGCQQGAQQRLPTEMPTKASPRDLASHSLVAGFYKWMFQRQGEENISIVKLDLDTENGTTYGIFYWPKQLQNLPTFKERWWRPASQ